MESLWSETVSKQHCQQTNKGYCPLNELFGGTWLAPYGNKTRWSMLARSAPNFKNCPRISLQNQFANYTCFICTGGRICSAHSFPLHQLPVTAERETWGQNSRWEPSWNSGSCAARKPKQNGEWLMLPRKELECWQGENAQMHSLSTRLSAPAEMLINYVLRKKLVVSGEPDRRGTLLDQTKGSFRPTSPSQQPDALRSRAMVLLFIHSNWRLG